jgi:quercetin dioxygenase-like cupin family protein
MITKATVDQTGGAFALLDQTVPGGYAPPRHIHREEDEAWYLLDGRVTFYCGSRTLAAGPGSFVFLPRGVEHTFKVGEDGARMLTITVPASFASFVAAAGEPAPQLTPPPPGPLDPERLAEVAAQSGLRSPALHPREPRRSVDSRGSAPGRHDCCQADKQRLPRADTCGMSAQHTDHDGLSWTTCLRLRIRYSKRNRRVPVACSGLFITAPGKGPVVVTTARAPRFQASCGWEPSWEPRGCTTF